MTSNQLLIKFALRYPLLIFLTVILSFSGALFNGIGTTLIIPLLLAFIGKEKIIFQGGPPILEKFLALFAGMSGDSKLFAMFGTVLLLIILKNAANYGSGLVSSHLSRSLVKSMRLEGIKLLVDVDLDFHSKNNLGYFASRINQEIGKTASAIKTLIGMASTVITASVFVFLLVLLSWQLTIIAAIILGIVAILNQYFVKRSRYFGRILSEKSREYTSKILEIIPGIRLIKSVSQEDREYDEIKTLITEREKAEMESQIISALMGPFNEISGIFAIFIMVAIGRYIFAGDLDSFSTLLLTYLVLLNRLLPTISTLNRSRSGLANMAYSAAMTADFLRRDNKPLMKDGTEKFTRLEKGIHLENLSFSYPGQEKLVLQQIDLWIPKGQTTALVGASGAGKSTIADLLPRFYDPTLGKITLDGRDLREFALKTIRGAMGIVSQDTFLFNNSVRYNIAYGREEATEAAIFTAAKRANAYDFIMELPQGFDTQIGDRGVMLSGGQRQRLAIARALLRDPDILILDEATSALDTVSERLVQQAIDELCRDRTTLVIAHRLSTIQKAHQIVVLDKGRIVEIGNHQELLQKNGYYARLYSMQFTEKPDAQRIVPLNESLLFNSIRASRELRHHLSYQVRNRLNITLGCLRLLSDELVDDSQEQREMVDEAYQSAIALLNTLDLFEDNHDKLTIEHNLKYLSSDV